MQLKWERKKSWERIHFTNCYRTRAISRCWRRNGKEHIKNCTNINRIREIGRTNTNTLEQRSVEDIACTHSPAKMVRVGDRNEAEAK